MDTPEGTAVPTAATAAAAAAAAIATAATAAATSVATSVAGACAAAVATAYSVVRDAARDAVHDAAYGVHAAIAAATLAPLRALYFQGPALRGWGFWAGQAPASICAQLTGMPATDYLGDTHGAASCAARLEREYIAFQTGVLVVLYVWALYSIASIVWWRAAVVRPMTAEVQRVLQLVGTLPLSLSPPRVRDARAPRGGEPRMDAPDPRGADARGADARGADARGADARAAADVRDAEAAGGSAKASAAAAAAARPRLVLRYVPATPPSTTSTP